MFRFILRYLKGDELIDEEVTFDEMYSIFRDRQKEFGMVECIVIDKNEVEYSVL